MAATPRQQCCFNPNCSGVISTTTAVYVSLSVRSSNLVTNLLSLYVSLSFVIQMSQQALLRLSSQILLAKPQLVDLVLYHTILDAQQPQF
jgi:hypothetical protein